MWDEARADRLAFVMFWLGGFFGYCSGMAHDTNIAELRALLDFLPFR